MSGVTNNCAVASTIIESGRRDGDNDRDTDAPRFTAGRDTDPRSSTWKIRKKERKKERERERESQLIDVGESSHREGS